MDSPKGFMPIEGVSSETYAKRKKRENRVKVVKKKRRTVRKSRSENRMEYHYEFRIMIMQTKS